MKPAQTPCWNCGEILINDSASDGERALYTARGARHAWQSLLCVTIAQEITLQQLRSTPLNAQNGKTYSYSQQRSSSASRRFNTRRATSTAVRSPWMAGGNCPCSSGTCERARSKDVRTAPMTGTDMALPVNRKMSWHVVGRLGKGGLRLTTQVLKSVCEHSPTPPAFLDKLSPSRALNPCRAKRSKGCNGRLKTVRLCSSLLAAACAI